MSSNTNYNLTQYLRKEKEQARKRQYRSNPIDVDKMKRKTKLLLRTFLESQRKIDMSFKEWNIENKEFQTTYNLLKSKSTNTRYLENTFKDLMNHYRTKGYKIPDWSTKHNLFEPSPLLLEQGGIDEYYKTHTFNHYKKLQNWPMNEGEKSKFYLDKFEKIVIENISSKSKYKHNPKWKLIKENFDINQKNEEKELLGKDIQYTQIWNPQGWIVNYKEENMKLVNEINTVTNTITETLELNKSKCVTLNRLDSNGSFRDKYQKPEKFAKITPINFKENIRNQAQTPKISKFRGGHLSHIFEQSNNKFKSQKKIVVDPGKEKHPPCYLNTISNSSVNPTLTETGITPSNLNLISNHTINNMNKTNSTFHTSNISFYSKSKNRHSRNRPTVLGKALSSTANTFNNYTAFCFSGKDNPVFWCKTKEDFWDKFSRIPFSKLTKVYWEKWLLFYFSDIWKYDKDEIKEILNSKIKEPLDLLHKIFKAQKKTNEYNVIEKRPDMWKNTQKDIIWQWKERRVNTGINRLDKEWDRKLWNAHHKD